MFFPSYESIVLLKECKNSEKKDAADITDITDITLRTLGIFFSIAVHVGLVYWLFTTQVPTGELQVVQDQRIIEVRPIPPFERMVIPAADNPPPEQDIIFTAPSSPSLSSARAKPDTSVQNGQTNGKAGGETGGEQSPDAAFPGFSLGSADQPLLQGKPDFLLPPGQGKLIPNPFAKGIPQEDLRVSRYASPFLQFIPGGKLALRYSTRPPPGSRMGGSGKGRFFKGVKGHINFNVKGLDITPWAKKVVTRLQQNWQIPPSLASSPNLSLSIGVKVVIAKSGKLKSSELKKSSQVEQVDKAVLLALNRSAPFPRLPEQFPKDSLEAYFWFNVNNNEQ